MYFASASSNLTESILDLQVMYHIPNLQGRMGLSQSIRSAGWKQKLTLHQLLLRERIAGPHKKHDYEQSDHLL